MIGDISLIENELPMIEYNKPTLNISNEHKNQTQRSKTKTITKNNNNSNVHNSSRVLSTKRSYNNLLTNLIQSQSLCKICQIISDKQSLWIILNRGLYHKFTSSQDYFYTKDINNIMRKKRKKIYIQYKDNLIYDDKRECLKKYFKSNESLIIIREIKEFYTKFKNYPRNFNMPFYKILALNIRNHRKIEYKKVFHNYETEQEKNNNNSNKYSFNILDELGNTFYNQNLDFWDFKKHNNSKRGNDSNIGIINDADNIQKNQQLVSTIKNNTSFNKEVGVNFKILKKIVENERITAPTPTLTDSIKNFELHQISRQDSQSEIVELTKIMKYLSPRSDTMPVIEEKNYQNIVDKCMDNNQGIFIPISQKQFSDNKVNISSVFNQNLSPNSPKKMKTSSNYDSPKLRFHRSNPGIEYFHIDKNTIHISSSPKSSMKNIIFQKALPSSYAYISDNVQSPKNENFNFAERKKEQKIDLNSNNAILNTHESTLYDFAKEIMNNNQENPIISRQLIGNIKSSQLNLNIAKILKKSDKISIEKVPIKNNSSNRMNYIKRDILHRARSTLFTHSSHTFNTINYAPEMLNTNTETESLIKKYEIPKNKDTASATRINKDWIPETSIMTSNNKIKSKQSLKNTLIDKVPNILNKYALKSTYRQYPLKICLSHKNSTIPMQSNNSGSPNKLLENAMAYNQPSSNNIHTEAVKNTISKKILAQHGKKLSLNMMDIHVEPKNKNLQVKSPLKANQILSNDAIAAGSKKMIINFDRNKLSLENISSIEYPSPKYALTSIDNNKKILFRNVNINQGSKQICVSPSKYKIGVNGKYHS